MHYIIIILDTRVMLDVLENTLTGIYALYKYETLNTLYYCYALL